MVINSCRYIAEKIHYLPPYLNEPLTHFIKLEEGFPLSSMHENDIPKAQMFLALSLDLSNLLAF